jgi:hypothetical protein
MIRDEVVDVDLMEVVYPSQMRVHKCTRKHFLYLMLCLRGDGVYI